MTYLGNFVAFTTHGNMAGTYLMTDADLMAVGRRDFTSVIHKDPQDKEFELESGIIEIPDYKYGNVRIGYKCVSYEMGSDRQNCAIPHYSIDDIEFSMPTKQINDLVNSYVKAPAAALVANVGISSITCKIGFVTWTLELCSRTRFRQTEMEAIINIIVTHFE
jgi:hypothetical protein